VSLLERKPQLDTDEMVGLMERYYTRFITMLAC